MPFTKAPVNDTYSSQRIPVVYGIGQREGYSQTTIANRPDEGLINAIPIKSGKEYIAQLRLPMLGQEVTGASGLTSNVRGIYVWEHSAGSVSYYIAVGNEVFRVTGTAPGTYVKIITWASTGLGSSSPVGFCEFIDGSNTRSLIIVDGFEGYTYGSGLPASATKITDVDFPSPHMPYPVFIDGYLFLAKYGTGDIYNSNLNSASAWTAGDFISSEVYPDFVVATAKINNYLLAIGTNGCEYFYDNANATGSPLARYEGAVLPFGIAFPNSLAVNRNRAAFIANMNDGEPAVVVIEDLKYKDITPPWLINYVNKIRLDSPTTKVYGYFLRQYGKLFYCLNIGPATFGYDFESQEWLEFASDGAGMPIYYTAFSPSYTAPTTFYAANAYGYSATNGVFGTLGQASITANIFQNDAYDSTYANGTIGSNPVSMTVRTTMQDFGTNNQKSMSRFSLYIESANPGTGVPVTVSWFDNDWNVSTLPAAQTVTKTFSPDDNFITQLGMFRSRAFRLVTGSTNYSFRIRWIEVDINKGQQ